MQSSDSDSTTTSETDEKHFTTSVTLDRLSIIDHSNITNESVAFHDAVLSSTLDFSDSSNLLNNIGISSNEDLVSPDFIPGNIRTNEDSDGYIPLEKCTSGNPQFAKQRQMQTKFTKNDAELLSFVPPSPCNHMNVSLHDSLPPLLPKKGKAHRTLGNSHSISGCENRNGRVIPNVDRNYYNNSPVAGRKLENIDADRRNNNTPFSNLKNDHRTNDASSADMIEHLDSAYQMSRNDSEHLHNRQNKNSLHSHLDLDNPVALPNSRTKHHIGNSVHTETNGYYDFSEPQDLFGMTPPTPPIKGSAEMKNVELQFSPEIRSSRNNPLKMCGEDHYYNVMGSQNNNG